MCIIVNKDCGRYKIDCLFAGVQLFTVNEVLNNAACRLKWLPNLSDLKVAFFLDATFQTYYTYISHKIVNECTFIGKVYMKYKHLNWGITRQHFAYRLLTYWIWGQGWRWEMLLCRILYWLMDSQMLFTITTWASQVIFHCRFRLPAFSLPSKNNEIV